MLTTIYSRFRKKSSTVFVALFGLLLTGLIFPLPVFANPYFFVRGDTKPIYGFTYAYSLYLHTDTSTLTAAQTVVTFDNAYMSAVAVDALNTRCSFFSPADPSLGYGNQITPYFQGSNKVVVACGFANPGYKSATESGDLVAKFSLTPVSGKSGATSFSFSNSMFRYIGSTISPGASEDFDLTVYQSTAAAYTVTNPTPTTSPDTLKLSDLTFKEIGTTTSTTGTTRIASSSGTTQTPLLAGETVLDDTIPPAPDLTPRPSVTPFTFPTSSPEQASGEVLSVQSLRELLLPGKSQADQTVVLLNLISTLTFLIILTILIWRLITVSRINKLKRKHMQEVLTGELSVLETKLTTSGVAQQEHVPERLAELRRRIESEQ